MNAILAQLAIAQQNEQLIEIHHFINPDTYTVGYVMVFTKEVCLVKSLDPSGKINGILIINLGEIYAIENDTDYLRAIAIKSRLAQKHGYYDIFNVDELITTINIKQENFLINFLKIAFKNKDTLTVGFTDDAQLDATVTGLITAYGDQKVTLTYVDDYDLSSLWTLTCSVTQINYVRIASFFTHEYETLMQVLFAEEI